MEIRNTIEESVTLFRAATQLAENAMGEAKALSEGSSEYHLKLGFAAYFIREYEIAQREFEKSFGLKKTSDAAARTGMSSFRLGNLAEAERWLNSAIELEPDGKLEALVLRTTTPYLSILASIQLTQGNPVSAEGNAKRAIELVPSDFLAGQVLTRVAALRGDRTGLEALAAAERAVKANAADNTHWLGLLKKDDRSYSLSLPIEFVALSAI